MKNPTDMGTNRTGIATSPVDSKRLINGARDGMTADPMAGHLALTVERRAHSESAEPLGTVPPPGSLKGAAEAVVEAIKGNHATVFLDLLAERLAFERTGARLYEALLVKRDAAEPHPGAPTREELEKIRDDEIRHFGIVVAAMKEMGGDPTAVTPSADAMAVASSGLVQLLADPRTTLTEALKAMLIAELTDRDAWILLADLADRLGKPDMANQFRDALEQEENHLAAVRTWVLHAVDGQLGLEVVPPEDRSQLGHRPVAH